MNYLVTLVTPARVHSFHTWFESTGPLPFTPEEVACSLDAAWTAIKENRQAEYGEIMRELHPIEPPHKWLEWLMLSTQPPIVQRGFSGFRPKRGDIP